VTEAEFALRIARALLPAYPEKALVFLDRALVATVDPRLRSLVSSALTTRKQAMPNVDTPAVERIIARTINETARGDPDTLASRIVATLAGPDIASSRRTVRRSARWGLSNSTS